MSMEELDLVVFTLRKTFEKNAWHGPSVKETLRDVTDELALKKPGNCHSIIELVGHMIAWRTFAAKKLLNETTYEVTPDLNFPISNSWTSTLTEL